MKTSNLIWGIFMILLGIGLLLDKVLGFDFFTLTKLWPLFILIPGLIMEMNYFFSKEGESILIPAGILTSLGCLFLFETSTNWLYSGYTWPFYILCVSIGLFQYSIFSAESKGTFIASIILCIIAVISFISQFYVNIYSLLLPIILIILGVRMVIQIE